MRSLFGSAINNYLVYDGLNNTFTEVELARNDNCPICGSKYRLKIAEILAYPDESIAQFRERLSFAFGMADPSIMYKGKILQDTAKLSLNEDEVIYVIDLTVLSLGYSVRRQSDRHSTRRRDASRL